MTTTTHPNGIAPIHVGTYQLGAKGGRMAQAWQHIWDRLGRTDYTDGMELAKSAADEFGLKPSSVSMMLCRMRAAGVIEQIETEAPTPYRRKRLRRAGESDEDYAQVPVSEFTSMRRRVHYRIVAGR
jgi:hypothetical protein